MLVNCEPSAKVTDVRLVQLKNALSPMPVTLAGIVMDARLVQFVKALSLMVVTE